jgi:hypothetical protein
MERWQDVLKIREVIHLKGPKIAAASRCHLAVKDDVRGHVGLSGCGQVHGQG